MDDRDGSGAASRGTVDRRWFLAAAGLTLFAAACGSPGGELASRRRQSLGTAATGPVATGDGGDRGAGSSGDATKGPARFVVRGDGARREVALTFHVDGDPGIADRMLRTLADAGAPMTAFVVGEWLEANPAWAERLTAAGHELANHTYTHPVFARLDAAAMQTEVERTRDLLVRLTGTPGRLFRPSGTANGTDPPSADVLAAAGAAGYRTVLGYDVDPLDYQDPGASAVVERTLAGIGPGSVVSLHFGHAGTAAALPGILDELAARGLVPVTASRLLEASRDGR